MIYVIWHISHFIIVRVYAVCRFVGVVRWNKMVNDENWINKVVASLWLEYLKVAMWFAQWDRKLYRGVLLCSSFGYGHASITLGGVTFNFSSTLGGVPFVNSVTLGVLVFDCIDLIICVTKFSINCNKANSWLSPMRNDTFGKGFFQRCTFLIHSRMHLRTVTKSSSITVLEFILKISLVWKRC